MDEFTKAINETQNEDFVGGDVQDNAIEFLRNAKTAVATFSQGKFISKMRKLKEQYPDEVQIDEVKNCSAIVARFPANWIKVSPPRTREMTEEQKAILRDRLSAMREAKQNMVEDSM